MVEAATAEERVAAPDSERRVAKYRKLIRQAATIPAVRTVVVHPCDETSLSGAMEAAEAGIIAPILVGPAQKIRSVAAEFGLNLDGIEIIDVPHSHAAAGRAVALVREGR